MLPASFLAEGEEILWQGGVDLPLLIRRQKRRLLIGGAVSVVLLVAMILAGWGESLRLIPILIVPVMLIAQGIARRNRERDLYLLTNQRAGVWSPPSGPAARMEGMETVGSGTLMLPLRHLAGVETRPNTVLLTPENGTGHFPIWMTDLPDALPIADRIRTAAGI